ncbi:DUF413 domain-containing protein [Thalassotalea litorea]|uniref:DUF413 domain-containing protein n=1 Tax=Thalassotalea litorea TaxID=2020715 RepID=UPI0037362DB8
MQTTIRKGKSPFYGEQSFVHGISRSGYFNRRESLELQEYGKTFQDLCDGVLEPDNEEELRFIHDMQRHDESSLYPVRLWKKYLAAVEKNKSFHSFSRSNGKPESWQTLQEGFA